MLDLRAISLMSLRVSTAAEPVVDCRGGSPTLTLISGVSVVSVVSTSRRRNVTGLKVKVQIKIVHRLAMISKYVGILKLGIKVV